MFGFFRRKKVTGTGPGVHYRDGEQFSPGTSSLVYQSDYTAPVLEIQGAGIIAHNSMRATARPLVALYAQRAPSDIFGIKTNEFLFQPPQIDTATAGGE